MSPLGGVWTLHRDERAFLRALKGCRPSVEVLPDGAAAVSLAPAGAPSACLVLYHGGGNDRLFGFWPLIECLVARGVVVLTADLPGHGAGGADTFSLRSARDRLDALVELARTASGGQDVLVLGQSMGGAFALDQMLRNDLAAGVIAVSVPARLALGASLFRELGALWPPEARRVLRYVPPSRAWPAFGPFGRARFPIRLAAGGSYVAAFQEALEALALLERLPGLSGSRPIWILHGEADGVVPVRQARALAEAIGSRARLRLVPRGSHFDLLLRDPVIRQVEAWSGMHHGSAAP